MNELDVNLSETLFDCNNLASILSAQQLNVPNKYLQTAIDKDAWSINAMITSVIIDDYYSSL